MAAPIKIIHLAFHDGVYLAGVVKQAVALAEPEAGESPSNSLGVTRVAEIRAEGPGVVVKMNSRWFFIPWASIRSCEIADPSPEKSAPQQVPGADLLGDEAALELATRPDKTVKPLR